MNDKEEFDRKATGIERQTLILKSLKASNEPITGSTFAKQTNVSRQVIVQDVSILKAKKEPIIATSQGYIYLKDSVDADTVRQTIVCKHEPSRTREELNIIVDNGVILYDVCVEHPVYGDLTALIKVGNRNEVDQFIKKVEGTSAAYLSELTDGIHLHTLEADSIEKIKAACNALAEAGILIEEI